MPQNILNRNVRSIQFNCTFDEYYDFMLFKGEADGRVNDGCLAASINFNKRSCIGENRIFSSVEWDKAQNDNVILRNIGVTGVDNGLLKFNKDTISNQEFLNLFTRSSFDTQGNKTFFMYPIVDNTKRKTTDVSFDFEDNKRYLALKGGFYQGFFKTEGYNYQTLPHFIENEWNLEFVLRPRSDYQTRGRTINDVHQENKGIFFYIGTRAENKFWELYANDEEKKYYDKTYSGDTPSGGTECHDEGDDSWVDDHFFLEEEPMPDVSELSTRSGYSFDKDGYYEFESDNKHLLFNRTCDGYTVEKWEEEGAEGTKFVFSGRRVGDNENFFLLFNRTCTGQTVDTIDKYLDDKKEYYNIYKGLAGNSFALKINDDGSIGYKYAIKDCDATESESPDPSALTYTVVEEYSKPNMVKDGMWNNVNVKFTILGNDITNKCDPKIGHRRMKIYIYVDGYLIFVSKELPELCLRGLDDVSEKQEAVPYNMSLGGGTQGLMDVIWLNFRDTTKYELPIEKNFAGTFIGDIARFNFYDCALNLATIRAHAQNIEPAEYGSFEEWAFDASFD